MQFAKNESYQGMPSGVLGS